jgi:GGDEF domain-containing protein
MSTPIDNATATLPQDATSQSATPQLPDPGNVLNQMPVSSPQGTLGVIPREDWAKAEEWNKSHGPDQQFKKAVFATSPKGKLGVLHPEDTPKAIQKGFQLGQPTPKTSIEEGSDAWYASKIPEPVMSVLSTIGKAFAAKDKAVHVAGDLAAAVPDLAVTPSGPDPSEVAANTKMAIAKGTHYSPTMPSDEEVNAAIHNAEVKHPVAMGVSRAIARTGGEMVADPLNWPFLASSAARPALQKLISGGFATQMGAGTIESARHLYNNWDQMTPEQRAEYATQTGLQGLFTAATAKHAASGVIEPAKEIVSQVGKGIAESKPGQMVSEAVQGARAAWNPEKNLTPEQAATKAFRPRNSKSNWKTEVASALPDMKRAAEQRGADIENISLEDAQKIANAAKKDVWSEYEQNHLDPAKPVKVPVGEVGDAMRSKITDRVAEQNPKLAKRIEQAAATYDNRNLSVGELQDRVSEINEETRAIEAKYVTDKRAAKLSPGNAYKFAERDTLRGLLDDALEQTGGEGGDLLRKRWGALTSVEDAISRRVPVNERKNPVSLTRVFELLHGPGRIIRGLAGGGPGDVAMGVFNTKAMLNAEKMNNPDWLTQQAFKKTTSRPPWMPREVHEGEYVGPATRGKIGSGLPWIGRTRGMLAQGGGFELPPASRTYGVPEQPIVDAPNTPIGNDVLENQPRGTVTPLGPTGKAGVLKRPFFLKGNVEAPAAPPEPIRAEPAPDRRQNLAERKRVEHMSPEEMKKELLTSPVTGLPNKRAFDEAQHQPAKAVAMSDADGLKALNDKFGYDAGNELLKAKAEALKEAGLDAYHEKGDEFLFRGASKEELHSKLEKAREILRNRVIEVQMKDGSVRRFKGADFSHGSGQDLSEAESGLKTNKSEREARGERARGELRGITPVESRPSAVSESPAQEVTAASPSTSPQSPAKPEVAAKTSKPVKEAWQMTLGEALGKRDNEVVWKGNEDPNSPAGQAHLAAVQKAIADGKPVPENVLEDYPWLKAERDIRPYVESMRGMSDEQLKAERKRATSDLNGWATRTPALLPGDKLNPALHGPEGFEASAKFNAVEREIESRKAESKPSVPAVRAAVKSQTPNAETPAAGSPEYEALKAKVSQLEQKRSGKGIVGVLGKKAEVANDIAPKRPLMSFEEIRDAVEKEGRAPFVSRIAKQYGLKTQGGELLAKDGTGFKGATPSERFEKAIASVADKPESPAPVQEKPAPTEWHNLDEKIVWRGKTMTRSEAIAKEPAASDDILAARAAASYLPKAKPPGATEPVKGLEKISKSEAEETFEKDAQKRIAKLREKVAQLRKDTSAPAAYYQDSAKNAAARDERSTKIEQLSKAEKELDRIEAANPHEVKPVDQSKLPDRVKDKHAFQREYFTQSLQPVVEAWKSHLGTGYANGLKRGRKLFFGNDGFTNEPPAEFPERQVLVNIPGDGHFKVNNDPKVLEKVIKGAKTGFAKPTREHVPTKPPRISTAPSEPAKWKYLERMADEAVDGATQEEKDAAFETIENIQGFTPLKTFPKLGSRVEYKGQEFYVSAHHDRTKTVGLIPADSELGKDTAKWLAEGQPKFSAEESRKMRERRQDIEEDGSLYLLRHIADPPEATESKTPPKEISKHFLTKLTRPEVNA